MFRVPERFRVREGVFGAQEGNNGAFRLVLDKGTRMLAIASDGGGWEHVSVSRTDRCPTWEEMCQVKDMFWSDEDCVVQFHPPKSEYVNYHPDCLHLWRQIGQDQAMPDALMVGIKG